jgi:hypothetical protein
MKQTFLFLLIAISTLGFSEDAASVSGVVSDSVSGSPIEAAEVTAVGDEAKQQVVTDVHGIFILLLREGIQPGDVITI